MVNNPTSKSNMDNYSHEEFQVTGYKISTTNIGLQSRVDIGNAWEEFGSQGISDLIQGKLFPGLHVVYFNYENPTNPNERSYDMLLGYLTDHKVLQNSELVTQITIPAQKYNYTVIKGDLHTSLIKKWEEINETTAEELPRIYAYDLEMYNEDMSEVTISISVYNK
jgi:predicted transcriptional regulator YdeE